MNPTATMRQLTVQHTSTTRSSPARGSPVRMDLAQNASRRQ